MIGALSARRRIVVVNAPVAPTFSSPATLASVNTLGGSGSFTFQFNVNRRTCNANTTSNSSAYVSTSFTYFTATDVVDPSDYEVMATLGTATGFSDVALGSGSASLGVWISLDSSPLFRFVCSDRRGGTRPVTFAIRHKVSTGVTGSTTITMNQSSDAVSPTFSGIGGTTSVIRTTTDTYLGVFMDSASSANAGQIRTYKSTTLFTQTGWTFSTGSIPESEYEVSTVMTLVTPSGGLITFQGGGGTYSDVSTQRAKTPAYDSAAGEFWSRLGTDPAATGRILINIRHKLDQNKFAQAQFDFSVS